MAIKKITISNFKSFDKVDIYLDKLNILIGANASGKSNFIQIFKFLKDLIEYGLENAISMQGGLEYLVNTNIRSSREFSIEILDDSVEEYTPGVFSSKKPEYGCEAFETSYKFALKLSKAGKRFEITKDELSQSCKFYNYIRRGKKEEKNEYFGEGSILINSARGKAKLSFNLPAGVKEKDLIDDVFLLSLISNFLKRTSLGPKQLLMELSSPRLFLFPVGRKLQHILQNISVYDFDPKLSKKAQPITGRVELEGDGSNLAIVINNLLKSRVKKRKLYNLLSDLLPFAEGFRIQKLADTVFFTLRERYAKSQSFPAFLLSDGTINLTALIIALFFEDKAFKIIEEPERNIHPYLISKVVDMMREASEKTQIITTTHNPEVVRHADPNEILLVYRTKNGYSAISKPTEKEEIKIFLENEMGIEELYVQNLLEV